MNENDAVNFKEELEKIKLRYRKEALEAVELAEIKGYAKGRSETLKNVEDKLLQWRAIAEATKSNDNGQSKPVLLVKYIVEQIYKHIKKDFPSEADKLKSTLLTVAESLLSSMPCIALVKSITLADISAEGTNNPASVTKTNGTIATKTMNSISATTVVVNTDIKPHEDLNHKVEFRTISKYWKSVEQRLFHKSPAAKYFIHINVKENIHTKTKVGFFGNINTDNLSFQVHTEIITMNQQQHQVAMLDDAIKSGQQHHRMKSTSFTSDNRMSDIKTLYQTLTKEFPKLTLPLYSSNTKQQRQPLLHHCSNNTDDKVNSVIRQIKMWLQYLANIECIQNSPNMLMFLTGTTKLVVEEADVSIKQNSNKQHIQTNPFSELYIYAAHNQPLLSTYGNYTISKKPSLIAYEDLQKVKRDLLNLEPSSMSVIESTGTLINAQTISVQTTKQIASSLNELRCFILAAGSDVSIGAAFKTSCQPLESIAEIWTIDFYEYLDFFESNCNKAMKETVDKTMKTYPQQSFIKHQSTSTILSTANTLRKHTAELSEGRVDSTSEPIPKITPVSLTDSCGDTVMAISQAWDRSNHIKSATMLHQILQMAHSFTDKYHKAKLNWMETFKMLQAMNLTTSTSGDQLIEHLTLKDSILNESQELDNILTRLRESFDKGNCVNLEKSTSPTQVVSENITIITAATTTTVSSWSFGAIFSRPKLPQGIRRQPKVPSFSDEAAPEECEVLHDSIHNTKVDDLLDNSAKLAEEEAYLLNLAETYNNLNNSVSEPHNEMQQGGGSNMDDPLMDRVKRHQLLRRHLHHQPTTSTKMKASIGSIATVTHLSEDVSVSIPRPAVPQTNNTASTSSNSAKSGNYGSYFPDSKVNHNNVVNNTSISNKPAMSSSNTTNYTMKSKDEIQASSSKNLPLSSSSSSSSSIAPPNNSKGIVQSHINQDEIRNNNTSEISSSPYINNALLPVGWEKVICDDGSIYYYHQVTRVSRWDCPSAEVAAALEARLHKSEEAAQKRVIEKEKERKLKVEMDSKINLALSKVKKTIEAWSHPPGARMPKDIGELLSTLHVILDNSHISIESILGTTSASHSSSSSAIIPLTINSEPVMIKKAYLRAVRFLHPDKLPDDMELETKLIAEAAFITLTDVYNKYRERIDLHSK